MKVKEIYYWIMGWVEYIAFMAKVYYQRITTGVSTLDAMDGDIFLDTSAIFILRQVRMYGGTPIDIPEADFHKEIDEIIELLSSDEPYYTIPTLDKESIDNGYWTESIKEFHRLHNEWTKKRKEGRERLIKIWDYLWF